MQRSLSDLPIPIPSRIQEAPLNPIKQDLTDAGELRYYHSNLTWNYGLLPQTWEDPAFVNPEVNATVGAAWSCDALGMRFKAKGHTCIRTDMRRSSLAQLIVQGDNDPTDVVEIGSTRFATGDIVPVKILGT